MSGGKPPPGYLPGLGKPRREDSRSSSPTSEQDSRSRSSSPGTGSESGDSQSNPNDSHGSEQLPVPPAAPAKAQEHLPGTTKKQTTTPTDPPAPSGGMLPRRSPRTEHEFNVLMCERLRASGYVSKGLLEHIATYLVDEEKVTKSDPTPPTYAEEEAILALAKNPVVLPAARPPRRQRSPENEQADQKRACFDRDVQVRRDPRLKQTLSYPAGPASASQPAPPSQAPPPSAKPPPPGPPAPPLSQTAADCSDNQPRSYAQATQQQAAATLQGTQDSQTNQGQPKAKKPRYPPIVIEKISAWATHLRTLKEELGRSINARPFGKGIRIIPTDETEFRLVQNYLAGLEKQTPTDISWFCYSPPEARPLKVAIRGIPVDTSLDEIAEDLRHQDVEVRYIRQIKARQGRPGCIYFAEVERSADTRHKIYDIKEILCMPGIRVENWRGKRGVRQCHRCQGFRHSSHNCHRPIACVRCGGAHSAKYCERPLTEPPTCANCKGVHTANSPACTTLRREARNKRAGTVAVTEQTKRPPKPQNNTVEDNAGPSLMAPANNPTPRDKAPPTVKKRRRQTKRKPNKPETTQPAGKTQTAKEPTKPQPTEKAPTNKGKTTLDQALDILHKIMLAIQAKRDPIPVILSGMAELITVQCK
ncbi:hypothetical protein O0L34_g18925 [Tuta absoluta]|nr:hypothetical protein O0L34_g18925 [Tuta absoluta]